MAFLALAVSSISEAADLGVTLRGALPDGTLVFQIYGDPGAFGRFRDPAREIVLSNDYRPKGPPSFDRASLRVEEDTTIEIGLFRVLGERGQIGVGLGAIGRPGPRGCSSTGLRYWPASASP